MLSPSAFIILASGKIKHTHTDRRTGATCAQRISLTYPVTWQEHSSKSIVCPAIHTHELAHWLSSIPIHLRSAIEHRWALISSRVSRRIQHRATHRRDVPGYVFSFSFFPFPSSSLCSLPLPRYRRFSFFFNVIFLQFRSFRFVSTRSVAVVIFYINWHWGSACHVGPGAAARGAYEMAFMLYVPVNCSL